MTSLTNKFRILHLATHTFSLIGLFWVFKTGEFQWLWLSFVWFLFSGIFGVNIALHRYFSHNSFKTSRFGYWFLLVASFFPMLGSPAAWGSIHRYHHQHSDSGLDPHSPNVSGKLRSWFTMWPEIEMPLSLFRSFVKDRNIFKLNQYYFSIVIVYVALLALIDWRLVCFFFALPAVGCFHGASAIAVIPHLTGIGGYRNHETVDNSHNHVLAWILSLGEGWHNNHHHNERNYRHGEKWWELDPSAFIIKHFLQSKK